MSAFSETFSSTQLHISSNPLTIEEFEARVNSLLQISPAILESTVIHQRDVEVVTGKIKGPSFSYPKTTQRVGYLINTLFHEEKESFEMIAVYVYKNPVTLKLLIEFLSNLDVHNVDDVSETIMKLRELFWSLTEK